MKSAILLASLAVTGAAVAADPAVVDKPRVALGDTWTYHTRTETRGGRKGAREETFEVTAVAKGRVHVVVYRKLDGTADDEPAEADMIFSDEWNVMVTGSRGARPSAILRPDGATLKFPARPGDSYPTVFELDLLPDAGTARHRRTTRVTGWEDVTVPAGKFRALRIESEGTVQSSVKPKPGPSSMTVWYVPEVRRWVRLEQVLGPISISSELTSYKLAP